jgi:hypothetical protein
MLDQEGGKIKGSDLDSLTLQFMKDVHPSTYETMVLSSSSVHTCMPTHAFDVAVLLDLEACDVGAVGCEGTTDHALTSNSPRLHSTTALGALFGMPPQAHTTEAGKHQASLTYLDLCTRKGITNAKDPANDTLIDEWVALKWVTRQKLPKSEAKAAIKFGYPKAPQKHKHGGVRLPTWHRHNVEVDNPQSTSNLWLCFVSCQTHGAGSYLHILRHPDFRNGEGDRVGEHSLQSH